MGRVGSGRLSKTTLPSESWISITVVALTKDPFRGKVA